LLKEAHWAPPVFYAGTAHILWRHIPGNNHVVYLTHGASRTRACAGACGRLGSENNLSSLRVSPCAGFRVAGARSGVKSFPEIPPDSVWPVGQLRQIVFHRPPMSTWNIGRRGLCAIRRRPHCGCFGSYLHTHGGLPTLIIMESRPAHRQYCSACAAVESGHDTITRCPSSESNHTSYTMFPSDSLRSMMFASIVVSPFLFRACSAHAGRLILPPLYHIMM